ncbi:MAG TPA: dihydrolipoyl dehydrogenase [Chloroflexi bacterium]|nr:dihydrolipoyl dehydrogenase [Chloroflexota bacterium]
MCFKRARCDALGSRFVRLYARTNLKGVVLSESYDVAILGAGPGGYVAALRAAQLGASVALVEKERVGGTCLNIGCIPTKALTTATNLLVEARRGADFGLVIPEARPDLPALMAYKQGTVDNLVGGVKRLLEERGVALVRGAGRLSAPDTLQVTDREGRAARVSARQVILAPGSVTARPPIPGLDLPGVMTSTEALTIADVPEHLIVVGGGVIGLEFASIYEALGSRVTILEMMPTLLPGLIGQRFAKRLAITLHRRGMTIQTGAAVRRIEAAGAGLRVVFEGRRGEEAVEGERVLIAVGRWPNTENLGLEEVGVEMDGRAVAVDERLQTSVPNVWAIGDAVGGPMFAHKAMVDGRVAAENALGGERTVDYRATPNVIFTRPEVAGVGLTQDEAREQGFVVKVTKFPFSATPKAQILGQTEGLIQLVCEEESGRVLGVHMMGPHVTDLIAEGALAVQMGLTADDLAWTTHAHPTLPEAMLEAALGFRDATIHITRKDRRLR